FIGLLAWMVTKAIPGEDLTIEYKPQHLDPLFIKQSSTVALSQAKAEIIRMGRYSVQGLEDTSNYVITQQEKHAEIAKQIEEASTTLDQSTTRHIVSQSNRKMSEIENDKHAPLNHYVRDIERICDHVENISELMEYKISNKINVTDSSIEHLHEMFDLTILT